MTAGAARVRASSAWTLAAWMTVLLVAAFALVPLAVMLMMSFSSSEFVRFPPPGLSLRWYESYFARADWMDATLRSLGIGVAVAAFAVVLGVPASLAIDRLGRRGAQAAIAVAILPIVLPPVVVAVAMYMTFAKLGLIGTRSGIVAGHLMLALPFVILTTTAALRRLDPSLARAARSLGAGRWRVALTVTLPLVRPGIVSGALLAFLTSFDELLIALFVGSPETRTLPRRMWEGVRAEFDPTIAAASAIVVLGTLVLAGLAFAAMRLGGPRRARP